MADNEDARRPLIDPATKDWDEEKAIYAQELPASDLEEQTWATRTVSSGTGKRILFLAWCIAFFVFLTTPMHLRAPCPEDQDDREGFSAVGSEILNKPKGKHFDGVRMQDLARTLIPGGEDDPDGERRLVFVGDIHGCADEFEKLLEKVKFDEQTDHLVAVGDLVSKGPKNVEVLDELIRLNASSVRGNHEDRLLAIDPSALNDPDQTPDLETSRSKKDKALLRQLSPDHLRFLYTLPLMLRIPPLPMAAKPSRKKHSPIAEEILVVHAGLVPGVTLEHQDPYFVMNMRSMYTKTHLPLVEAQAKKGKSKPWSDVWDWYNDRLSRKKSLKDFQMREGLDGDGVSMLDRAFDALGLKSKKKWPKPQVVVYGHHAKAGLQIARWSKGLDTGCVRGRKLTAMVLSADGKQEIVSVKCKDHRK